MVGGTDGGGRGSLALPARLQSLAGASSLRGRRALSAAALAVNGGGVGRGTVPLIRAGDLAALAGVSAETVLADWRRDDVRAEAARLAVDGLADVLRSAARAGSVLLAARAAAGDADAVQAVAALLGAAGEAAPLDSRAAGERARETRGAVGAVLDADAAAALEATRARLADRDGAPPSGGRGGCA